jgi:hypothetical protein
LTDCANGRPLDLPMALVQILARSVWISRLTVWLVPYVAKIENRRYLSPITAITNEVRVEYVIVSVYKRLDYSLCKAVIGTLWPDYTYFIGGYYVAKSYRIL